MSSPVGPSTSGGSPVIIQSPKRGAANPFHDYVQTAAPSQQIEVYTSSGMMSASSSPSAGSSLKRQYGANGANYGGKRSRTERLEKGKGLRHFSMKVCEKVQRKTVTTYNEVADELVHELSSDPLAFGAYDQKNIRRRVYDALNVLMAMNIISKEKKEIRWIGLPTNCRIEVNKLEEQKAKRLERIEAKTQQLYDLIIQQIAYKNLVERNKRQSQNGRAPPPHTTIQLPFIIINTDKSTVIDCSISNDKKEYLFNFDNAFEINDDIEVLKRMGMAFGLDKQNCSSANLEKAKKMVPANLVQYVSQMATCRDELPSNMLKVNGGLGHATRALKLQQQKADRALSHEIDVFEEDDEDDEEEEEGDEDDDEEEDEK